MIAAGLLRSALDARSISSRKSFVRFCMLRVAKSSLDRSPTYKDLRVNMPLCQQYVDDMRRIGEGILVKDDESYTASTDMGNVSYEVPSFHGAFPIPTDPDVSQHHPRFAAHAGTDEAHEAAIKCGKGLAMLAIRVLTKPHLADEARRDFEHMTEG